MLHNHIRITGVFCGMLNTDQTHSPLSLFHPNPDPTRSSFHHRISRIESAHHLTTRNHLKRNKKMAFLTVEQIKKDWAENPRWQGIKRGYSAEDVGGTVTACRLNATAQQVLRKHGN